MSTKNRVKFTVAGFHPLLTLIRDRLIAQGFALIPWDERPDFVLFGAKLDAEDNFIARMGELTAVAAAIAHSELPVFLLSDSEPCPESPLRVNNDRFLIARTAEYLFTQNTRTMVVRPYNVYGEDIKSGVVHAFVEAARRGQRLPVIGHMYQKRMFLYQEDFYTALDKLLLKFLKGARGVYDVAGTSPISIKRLADTVYQLTPAGEVVSFSLEGADHIEQLPGDEGANEKFPDSERTKAFINWKPKTSLRQGLMYMGSNA